MEIISILNDSNRSGFYALTEEYLPDSSREKMERYSDLFPKLFIALELEGKVVGVAFGWNRQLEFPEDNSFVLNGIAVTQNQQKKGYGKLLLQAFENGVAEYGGKKITIGSAEGYVEKFYIDCGYSPIQYKVWQDGSPIIEKTFDGMEDYLCYKRKSPHGFIIMSKDL